MVHVETQTVIKASRSIVSSFAGHPDNAPLWYVNIKSVKWESTPPLEEGSKVAFVAHFLGRQLEYTYQVVAYEPGEKLVMRTAQGPFPMETIYIWDYIDEDHTRMTLINRGKPKGFSMIFSPFMSWMMRRANEKDLARLKYILEGGNARKP